MEEQENMIEQLLARLGNYECDGQMSLDDFLLEAGNMPAPAEK